MRTKDYFPSEIICVYESVNMKKKSLYLFQLATFQSTPLRACFKIHIV